MTWRTLAFTIVMGLLGAVAVVPTGRAAAAGWLVKDQGNPIDPKVKAPFATVPASQPFSQLGRKVTVRLLVTCGLSPDGKSKSLESSVAFSEAAALSPRPVRWRIGQQHSGKGLITAYPAGTVLTFGRFGSEEVIGALLDSRSAEIEIDLPWAGTVKLRFDTAGAAESFSKIPCSGPASQRGR